MNCRKPWLRELDAPSRRVLVVLLLGVAAVIGLGITWGLPAADGWDDDGVAPRDYLVGVVQTYLPGEYYRYPPVHLLLLTVLTAPGWLTALIRAQSTDPQTVIAEITRVPYMTAFALVARWVSLVMALGIVVNIYRITRELHNTRAAEWAAVLAGLGTAFIYYGKMTNLDVPYLFWGTLALTELVLAISRFEPARIVKGLLFAALAVGTKDQAYALFLCAWPVAGVWWLVSEPRLRRDSEAWRALWRGLALAVLLLLAVDGALSNPSGFRQRIAFLLGSASAEHANYTKDLWGRCSAVRDVALNYVQHYPLLLAPLTIGGILLSFFGRCGTEARRCARLLPVLTIASFTLAFNASALRAEHRFILPQMTLLAIPTGMAIDALLTAAQRFGGGAVAGCRAYVGLCVAVAAVRGLALDFTLLRDPRYDVEAWLKEHLRPGDSIEAYGGNTSLPRFPCGVKLWRVDSTPPAKRNPLACAVELQGEIADAPLRGARYIVFSQAWVWPYQVQTDVVGHRSVTPWAAAKFSDVRTRRFLDALMAGRGPYRWAFRAEPAKRWLWPVDIHGATARPVYVFARANPADQ